MKKVLSPLQGKNASIIWIISDDGLDPSLHLLLLKNTERNRDELDSKTLLESIFPLSTVHISQSQKSLQRLTRPSFPDSGRPLRHASRALSFVIRDFKIQLRDGKENV